MSGEVSPQAGSGLEVPPRPDRAGDDSARASKHARAAEPSLARVLGTTLRLWTRRRVLRVADGANVGAARWTAVSAVVLVVAVAAGGVVLGARPSHHAPPRPRVHAPSPPPVSPAQAATTANEQAAASWIVSQAVPSADVGCDQVMCGYLQSAGLLAAQQESVLSALTQHSGSGTVLVVATPAARATAGTELNLDAPQVIASFGSGGQQVQVLVSSAQSPAAFRAAARTTVAAGKRAGRALGRNHRLHLYGHSRHVLLSGLVDRRLLVVLKRLLSAYPVYVTGFGDSGPGGGWPNELRAVNIVHLVRGSGKHRVSEVGAVLRLLRRQHAPYRPILHETRQAGGAVMLTIEFLAPSPA